MTRLSDKSHWDQVHAAHAPSAAPASGHAHPGKLKSAVKRLLGPTLSGRMRDYGDHLLWDVHFRRHLPDLRGGKVIEVGSAPGTFIADFAEAFGATPYGVEYSDTGARANRAHFAARGVDPENLIHADFFSASFRDAYHERFDVVISRGFIEHFTDVDAVIDGHMRLLKPGGTLIVGIPNLRGANGLLTRLFHPALMPLHNLDIMRLPAFSGLFDRRPDLRPAFCGHIGTFNFNLFYAPARSPWRPVLWSLHRAQPLLNLAFRTLFRDRGCESATFSPGLLYIGRKIATSA